MDVSDILRKIKALANIANDPTVTEHEAATAMTAMNRLMIKYNISQKDVEFSSADINASIKQEKVSKHSHPMGWVVMFIADLSDTKLSMPNKYTFAFIGTGADSQYAQWLYDLIHNVWKRASKVYKMTKSYKELNKLHHGTKIMTSYERGFFTQMQIRLKDLINEKSKGESKELVLKKQEIINSFMKDKGIPGTREGQVAKIKIIQEAAVMGMMEADNVKLMQEMGETLKIGN